MLSAMRDGQQDSKYTTCEKPEGIVVKNKDSKYQGSNQDQLRYFGRCLYLYVPQFSCLKIEGFDKVVVKIK